MSAPSVPLSFGYQLAKATEQKALVETSHVLLGWLRVHGVDVIPDWWPTEFGHPILHLYRLIDHEFGSDMHYPHGGSMYLFRMFEPRWLHQLRR